MPPRFPRISLATMGLTALMAAMLLASGQTASADAVASAALHEHTLPSMLHKGFVYLKVSVNQHPEVWMMLDSGTTESIIDTAYAKTVGLKLTPSKVEQATFGTMKPQNFDTDTVHLRVGREAEQVVMFEAIGLGGMKGPDGVPAAGMLGRTYLAGKSIVIDYKAAQVYLETTPAPADPRDVPMTLGTGIPIIQLDIAGRAVGSLIDTGGTYGMIITPATAKVLGIEHLMADAKPAQTMGHGGEQHIVVGKAPPFSVGKLAVQDLSAAYTTFGTATDAIGAGVSLGIGFLKNYKVTLNYVTQTVRFEP